MSKIKNNAIDVSEQAIPPLQALAAPSSAYNQIDSFSHQYDRGGNLTVNGKPSFSVEQAATQLLRDGAAYQDRDGSGKIELTYTFLTSASSSTMNKHGITGFSQFSTQQKAQAVLAMQSWADVANVTFTNKSTGGDGHMTPTPGQRWSTRVDWRSTVRWLQRSPSMTTGSSVATVVSAD